MECDARLERHAFRLHLLNSPQDRVFSMGSNLDCDVMVSPPLFLGLANPLAEVPSYGITSPAIRPNTGVKPAKMSKGI